LILTLDLYFKIDISKYSNETREIIELSEMLNKLPFDDSLEKSRSFRNPNGVYMKLMNFKACDPNYHGMGLSNGSKLDKEIFETYVFNRQILSDLADSIKTSISDNAKQDIDALFDLDEKEFIEGRVLYKQHILRERNRILVKKAKEEFKCIHNKLFCEVCGFDFEDKYGIIGKDFIEAHHILPVSSMGVINKTKTTDLIMVCSNCHRMIHRKRPWINKDSLAFLVYKKPND